ncbi:hypothetical protein GCM10023340_41570 [Nocardioides marinquilinus]|uniref:GerMN domain-containing protein n=1 Tax=Nocardioides marinquilinus TaxID=1210400 RepID=A0ABP9Q8H6_9ACTN
MRRTTRLGVAGVLTLGVALAGCSDGGDGGDGGGGGGGAGGDDGVSAALERLPAPSGDGQVIVRYTDLAAVREANGLDVPDVGDPEAVSAFVRATADLEDGAAAYALPTALDEVSPPDESVDRYGFSWVQADLVVGVQSGAPALASYAFADDVEAPDDLVETGTDSVLGVSEEGPFLAVDGSRAAVTVDEPLAQAWLDPDATLADDDVLADLAAALDDEGAITAQLSTLGDDQAVGIGLSVEDGRPAFAVAYRLASDEAAEGAVDQLRREYADVDELEVDDVEADGSVVTVTGRSDEVSAPIRLYNNFGLPVPG